MYFDIAFLSLLASSLYSILSSLNLIDCLPPGSIGTKVSKFTYFELRGSTKDPFAPFADLVRGNYRELKQSHCLSASTYSPYKFTCAPKNLKQHLNSMRMEISHRSVFNSCQPHPNLPFSTNKPVIGTPNTHLTTSLVIENPVSKLVSRQLDFSRCCKHCASRWRRGSEDSR